MNNYDKYKFLKEELKAPRFENEDEEIEWFTTQLYGLYKQSYRLRQENQQLKEQNEFLIKRENKLQQIEMMFKNRSVDLEELSNLILEKMKGKDK